MGFFSLSYPKNYTGMGFLNTQNNSNLILLLTEKNIRINGKHLQQTDPLVFTNSTDNTNFAYYAKAQGLYSNASSAWRYLENIYANEPSSMEVKEVIQSIRKEQQRIKKEDSNFISDLEKEGYIRWFIPYRKRIQEMPMIVREQRELIPEFIAHFRTTDLKQANFKSSGLFKEWIEGHYLLLENMGQSLDSVYSQMNISTQYLIDHLQSNKELLNTVSSAMFDYLEKRSLFRVSKYLSLSLLKNHEASLDKKLISKLESYRKVGLGSIASDIDLGTNKLSDIKTTKLLVFGLSGSIACEQDRVVLLKNYAAWKANKITIVNISLDTDKTAYETAYKNQPWQTYCDFKGYETQAAKDYFITVTPSYILLDKDNRVLTHLKSVEHAEAWINQSL